MVNKVRKEMQTPLMQLKLKMIQDNVERWDSLWASYEGHYQEMTDVETRVFYAELHVIANDTMNELSSIRKQMLKNSVPLKKRRQRSQSPGIVDADRYSFS